jgi:GAF domain-containing protein
MKFCGECGTPLTANPNSLPAPSYAEIKSALNEALGQQTATAEVLRVISSSPTDIQPVFDAIVQSAVKLCNAGFGAAIRFDGERLHLVAHHNWPASALDARRRVLPRRPDRSTFAGRAILDGTVLHLPDIEQDPESSLPSLQMARSVGYRSTLIVPMLRDGLCIGAIAVGRAIAGPFSDKQITLLQTFADQAVIAIENVRMFKELQEKNLALAQALEQQTATTEVLKVISRSVFELEPVLHTLVENAARLCSADSGQIRKVEGEVFPLVATFGMPPQLEEFDRQDPPRAGRGTIVGRAALERHPVHIPDVLADPEYQRTEAQKVGRYRTLLGVPMLREGALIGVFVLHRFRVEPFTEKQIELVTTFADQAVIAIENVRLFTELQGKNRALTEAHAQVTEALEQQTATAEILRVISSSPTELQPVFDVIAKNAFRLCGGAFAILYRYDGVLMSVVADVQLSSEGSRVLRALYPAAPRRDHVVGLSIIDSRIVHTHDVSNDARYSANRNAFMLTTPYKSSLVVPMRREGAVIGAIAVARAHVQPYDEGEIELLKTFADQAVIAIENVRLFTELGTRNRELTEALDQQTATSEILRVIASSPTDLQPVLESVAESSARVCSAADSEIWLLTGEYLRPVTRRGSLRRPVAIGEPVRVNRGLVGGRAVLDRQTVHVEDVLAAEAEFPEAVSRVRQSGATTRTMLATPLLREGTPLGVIFIDRGPEPSPFSPKQIALLETFANQAVIAIENVRLFTELEARNTELTEALEQQTATGEVLKVISRSTFDLDPVLQTLVESAARLCGAQAGLIYRVEDGAFRVAAHYATSPEILDVAARVPIRAGRGSATGRAALERRTVHIPDVLADPDYTNAQQSQIGNRTILAVPMQREETLLGVFALWRTRVQPFSDKQIELVTTFADQAVIAVENVRLFTELQARTRELIRSVEELKALGEVSQAVSSTLDLQTVLTTIVGRAVQLSGTGGGVIYEYDEATQGFQVRATDQIEPEHFAALRASPIRLGQGAVGQAAATRTSVQVPDILTEGALAATHIRPILARSGYRSILAVPLLFEQRVMGGLVVWRREAGPFDPGVVDLLQTFATQSVLAIQNARLFHEIADKSRQLEAASRHKSEFLANMSHELRTPLNAILGFSEVLAERMFGEVNEKQAEYLQDILSSGRHLLSLINDILDLAKVEAGRLELELGRFHLPTALDNALTLVRERATRHGIMLTQTVDPTVGHIVADERKVKQILLNLLSNGVKFTPEGGRVGLTATSAEDGLTIAVSDTGIGIAPEDQATIFEEFRQVGSGSQKQEGTGLGLTLTKKFVELHGGRIWVSSEMGKGSTFAFILPVRPWPTSAS